MVVVLNFFTATPVASVINAAIVVLVVWGVIDVSRGLTRVRRESGQVSKLEISSEDSFSGDSESIAGTRLKVFESLHGQPTLELQTVSAADAEDLHGQVAVARALSGVFTLLEVAIRRDDRRGASGRRSTRTEG